MKLSIRKFLLLNLLLAVTVTTTLTVVGNYYLEQRDIQRNLDSLLKQSSLLFRALITMDVDSLEDFEVLQEKIKVSQHSQSILMSKELSIDNFQFQVLGNNGEVLLHSINSSLEPLSNLDQGFSDKEINEHQWRIYTVSDDEQALGIDSPLNLHFIVAERYDIRNELARRIAEDDLYIMLWTYPLSGLLIWLIIGKGFSSLRVVEEEVSSRAHDNLEPVNTESVPEEVRSLVEELNRLFLRLKGAIERERRFSSDAAHELRTPLAALKTQAQTALTATTEQERKTILNNVIMCVDRSMHVVQQLLTMSRLSPEDSILHDASKLNLAEVVQDIICQSVPEALERNLEIEFIHDEREASWIMGNRTSLSILLRNLLDNAIRYTGDYYDARGKDCATQGEVKVYLAKQQDQVVLTVSDNGPGIPVELRARVFERFFRGFGNTSTGSGLGLAIAEKVCQMHNAKLRLGSPNIGTGLEVEVSFPACD